MGKPFVVTSEYYVSPRFEVEPDHRGQALFRWDAAAERHGARRALRIQQGASVAGFAVMAALTIGALVRLWVGSDGTTGSALAFLGVTALAVAPLVGHARWAVFVLQVRVK